MPKKKKKAGGARGGREANTEPDPCKAARAIGGGYSAAKAKIVRAWVEAEIASGTSLCSSFAWAVEKCSVTRTEPVWTREEGLVPGRCDFNFECASPRASGPADAQKPLEVLVQAALVSAAGLAEFTEVLQAESHRLVSELFVSLYELVQSHKLRASEFCRLIDALGSHMREEIQLGPILRSINSRSCPAAVAHKDFYTIADEAYCQVCHKTNGASRCAESAVYRCGGCGVVAFCSEEHARQDLSRHGSWCSELLFSRVLRCALPPEQYYASSRRVVAPHPYIATHCVAREKPGAGGRELPLGWLEFFAHRAAQAQGEDLRGSNDKFDDLVATDALSSVLTITRCIQILRLAEGKSAAMPKPGGLSSLASDLCIHLLGADHEQNLPWEELFAWLPPSIRLVNLVMVGPHAKEMAPTTRGNNGLFP